MEPFIGEIFLFSFGFPPKGFAFCNGQLLPINQNQALFSLLGTTYGGNGTSTFALPNLQGSTPMHAGGGYVQGQVVGSPSATLTTANIPAHNHSFSVSKNVPVNASPGSAPSLAQGPPQGSGPNFDPAGLYSAVPPPGSTLAPGSLATSTGSAQTFSIEQPYLAMNFSISLIGIFPSRS